MSRSVTSDTLSRLARPSGEAPLPVVKLFIGSQVFWFSDRTLTQAGLRLDGRIESIGDLSMNVKIDRQSRVVGTVGVVNVKLLDEDQALLHLMDSNDLQGCKGEVYHWYEGQTQADLMLLLKGRIEAPPVWDENDRTLSITIETPRRLKPIPFAPTEADGLAVDLDHLGKEWPMCFGRPSDVPATMVKDPPRGTLTRDMTEIGDLVEQDAFGEAFSQKHETNVFLIDNPDEDFPQGVDCLVKIADEYVLGKFSGNTLTVSQRQVNKYSGFRVSGTTAQITVPAGIRAVGSYIIVKPDTYTYEDTRPAQEIVGLTALAETPFLAQPDSLTSTFIGYVYKQVGNVAYTVNGSPTVQVENAVADVNRYPYTPSQGAVWVHKAGSPVVVQSVKPVFVVNQIGSTSVLRVRAWRQVTHDDRTNFSQRQLVVVPRSLYTVNLANAAYNGATTITLTEMLRDREAGWDDSIYVTLVSTVGSNTSDAIKYLINYQSEGKLTADTTSFATVKTALANYPSDFAILHQGDVLDVCGDIAWQARCGIRWDGSTASIVYLSKKPTAVTMALTDSVLAEGSIKLTTTRIEDVVTVFNTTWKANYSDRVASRILYRTNVERYGKREQTFDFWIYQRRRMVDKSAKFWAARMGRIWRVTEDETWGLEGLPLTALDYAKWNIADFYSTVYGLVTEAKYQDDCTGLTAMLPIEAGSTTESGAFWVSDSGDSATAAIDYSGEAGDLEYVQTIPPDEINTSLKPSGQRPVADAAQEIFSVVAVTNENTDPSSLSWKTVRVYIIDPKELTVQKKYDATLARLAQIAFLDPGGVNYTLNVEKATLLIDKEDLKAQLDFFQSFRADNPVLGYPTGSVEAHNPSVSYMLKGDPGTMIYQNQEYVVTPSGSSGPFIAKVTKPPASPAEGTLYADTAFTTSTTAGSNTKQIKILGDGSSIKAGDAILVFRDSSGSFYTQGGGASGQMAMAKVLNDCSDRANVPIGIWLTNHFADDPDLTTVGAMPQLATGAKIPAGAWSIAVKLDGEWVLQVPVFNTYVA